MSNPDVRLGPDQALQPMVAHFKFKPPFETGYTYKRLVGAEGQLPQQLNAEFTPEQLQEMYDRFIADPTYNIIKDLLQAND